MRSPIYRIPISCSGRKGDHGSSLISLFLPALFHMFLISFFAGAGCGQALHTNPTAEVFDQLHGDTNPKLSYKVEKMLAHRGTKTEQLREVRRLLSGCGPVDGAIIFESIYCRMGFDGEEFPGGIVDGVSPDELTDEYFGVSITILFWNSAQIGCLTNQLTSNGFSFFIWNPRLAWDTPKSDITYVNFDRVVAELNDVARKIETSKSPTGLPHSTDTCELRLAGAWRQGRDMSFWAGFNCDLASEAIEDPISYDWISNIVVRIALEAKGSRK